MTNKLHELFHMTVNIPYTTVGTNVDYAIQRKNHILYIYFQCSYTKLDWVYNFMFGKKPYKDMDIPYRVHRGFLKCWKKVEDIIIDTIKDPTIKEIYICGYSHGAALSMLCHECCWYHRPDIRHNIWGIGFESPRVYAGYKIKSELQNRWAQYLMIRNHNDIVTHLPPRIFGFAHVGTTYQIGLENEKVNCIDAHRDNEVMHSLNHCKNNSNWKQLLK